MDALAKWLDLLEVRVLAMQDFDLPSDVVLDYSAGSLARLEQVLSNRRGGGHGSLDEEFVLGAAAYFGKALVRTGGGKWGWDGDADEPLVVPDRTVGLLPAAPVAEVLAASREPCGRLAELHGEWVRAAATLPDLPPEDRIVGWLARQEAGFPAWAAAYAPDVVWDFTRDSLDALEEVMRRVVSLAEELMAPEHRSFWDNAAWYLGEVLRRGLGGFWASDVDQEFLRQVGPRRGKIIPSLTLMDAYDTPGYLRQRYDLYARVKAS